MSSFTPDQVSHFRQVFSMFTNEDLGGVDEVNFLSAIQVSLEQCNFSGSPPSQQYLENEFRRLASENDNPVVLWQQFFQVLIHLNLRQSASPPPPPVAREEPREQSIQRVQFNVEDVGGFEQEEPPPPSYDDLEQDQVLEQGRAGTLGRQLLRSVGGFFGLTQESQRGNHGEMGWQEYAERNIEESTGGLLNTLSRRASLRNRVQQRPPSYPAVATGRSFNLDELGDSDEENGGLTQAPPPMYFDVVESTSEGHNVAAVQQQRYPEPTRPSAQRSAPPTSAAPQQPADLIYDQRQAWDYYLKYTKAEKKLRNRRHQTDAYEFFGSADEGTVGAGGRGRSGSIRRERLNSAEPDPLVRRRPKKPKRTKLQRQSTLIRTEVESLPTFWPVFIVFISIAQVVAMIVLLPIYGLAPIDVFPLERTEEFPSLQTINATDNVTYFRSVNLWIGHTPLNLIRLGAKYSPCMRTDFGIRVTVIAPIRERSSELGCCQNQEFVGTTLITECGAPLNFNTTSDRFFEPRTPCSDRNSSTFSLGGANFHPCCISITGQCRVMDMEECEARGGFFHVETDSCDKVNCFRDICGFDGALVGEEADPVTGEGDPLAATPQQFWRFFTATYLHLGVIHFLIIIPIQLYVGIKIERTIGWLRILIIYTLSGVGGNLVSAIFIPYGVNAGASGAVFGLLGVLYVELFQFWQIVDRAWLELIKLSAFVVFLLALGTLPYVDNMAHIGGLLFGVPTAIIFVPYLTFGKLDAVRKRILLVICVPLVIILFLVGFLTFYLIPTPGFCTFCHYINCIPYSANLCPQEFSVLTPNATIFSL